MVGSAYMFGSEKEKQGVLAVILGTFGSLGKIILRGFLKKSLGRTLAERCSEGTQKIWGL